MAQNQTPDLSRLLIAAVVVALLLSLGDIALELIETGIDGGTIEIGNLIENQIDDIAGEVATLVGVVLVLVTAATKSGIVRGAGIAYVGSLINSVLFTVLNDYAEIDAGTFIWSLAAAFFVVGVAMVYRLLNRQTILPGVGIRI